MVLKQSEKQSETVQECGAQTVASLARDWAQRAPAQIAMREKHLGVWREYTWKTTWDLIEVAAHGLLALGVSVGDRVAIHSEDRPEWVILDLAAVAVRAITVGLYPTNPVAEVEYLIGDCTPAVFLAEDQEQVDKVLEVLPVTASSIRSILYVEPRGFSDYSDQRLLFWDDFLEMGRRYREAHQSELAERMSQATNEDIVTIVYTSGTTGPPKGAMISNGNVAYSIDKIVNETDRFPSRSWLSRSVLAGIYRIVREPDARSLARVRPANPKDFVVTYLPLCHVAERLFSTWTLVGAGPSLNFAESIETVITNLREIQPTLFFAVPRIWERLHASIAVKSNDATYFKRIVLKFALVLAGVIGKEKAKNGGRHTWISRPLYWIGQPLVFRAMKERVGLRRCRHAASAAAAIAPEVLEFFIGIGVPVFELYGMTENVAVATCNFAGRMKLGTVGEPYGDIGFRIDPDTGEIQIKHNGVFVGYWNQLDKTDETFTDDGWLMTGDVGEWVDGTHVKIVDRIKHIIITSGGKNISPSEIENSLKASPYVREAMAIGDGRKYVTALIGIELETVGDWAQRKGIPYTTYRDLSEREDVINLISSVVEASNSKFSPVEQVKKFRLLPKELDHEDGELTATQKIKRSMMGETFGDLVESNVPVSALVSTMRRAKTVVLGLHYSAQNAFFVGLASVFVTFALFQLLNDPSLFFQTFMQSMGLGSVYALIALGFVIIFKATQTINFSQGALAAAGALFLTFLVNDNHIPFTTISNPLNNVGGPGWVSWMLNLFVALIFVAALGFVVEVLAIRPMVGQPLFSMAVITLGLEVVLRVFNDDAVETSFRSLDPPWGIKRFNVGDAIVNWSSVAVMVTAVVAFTSVYFFYRSRFGIAMRAVAFDQEAAMTQGVNVGRVFAIAWCVGSVLAAIAGIFATQPPLEYTLAVTEATAGTAFRALPAVILGGLDSVSGALLGGILVGVAEVFAGQYAEQHASWLGSGYHLTIPYVVMIIGLLVRPYGLFGTPEIRRV